MGRGCTRRAFGLAGAAHIVHVFDVSSRSCLGDARTFSVYDDEYPSVGAAREDGYADGVAVMMMMGCGDHAIYVQALFAWDKCSAARSSFAHFSWQCAYFRRVPYNWWSHTQDPRLLMSQIVTGIM